MFLITKNQFEFGRPPNGPALVSWSFLPPIDKDATLTMEDGNIN